MFHLRHTESSNDNMLKTQPCFLNISFIIQQQQQNKNNVVYSNAPQQTTKARPKSSNTYKTNVC